MDKTKLPIETTLLQEDKQMLHWPSEVPANAYTLVYTHSELKLDKNITPLNKGKLYEAWAFDGKTSWHIWQREDEWVCTAYNTTKVSKEDSIEEKQLLAGHKAKNVKKSVLVVHQTIAYDNDGQAYIAYACPIDLR